MGTYADARTGELALAATATLSFTPGTREDFAELAPPPHGAYLCNMATLPELRRRGVARAMLGACVDFCAHMGDDEVRARARARPTPSHPTPSPGPWTRPHHRLTRAHRHRRVQKIWLHARVGDTPSVGLYEACGFEARGMEADEPLLVRAERAERARRPRVRTCAARARACAHHRRPG